MSKMQYNICETCGAKDGRAGSLFGIKGNPAECKNCYETRSSGEVFIDTTLERTEDELKKTMDILNP